MKGTLEEAREYCSKEKGKPGYEEWSIGRPMEKTDMDTMKRISDMETGVFFEKYKHKHPKLYRKYYNMACKLVKGKKYVASEPMNLNDNMWFYGAPGTGKTSTARKRFTPLYKKDWSNDFWDRYEGQMTVVLEDMPRKVPMSLQESMKRWMDYDPFWAKVKLRKTTRSIRPQRFIVTSQQSPVEAGFDVRHYLAMHRRITMVKFPLMDGMTFEDMDKMDRDELYERVRSKRESWPPR